MLKSSTPVIVLILSFLVGREKPSVAQLAIMMIISFGVILSTAGEVKFNLLGFIIQFTAVFCECSRSLIMDMLLSNKKLDSLSMLYYMAPISSLTLFAGFLYFESAQFLTISFSPSLLLALFLNGCLSFSLNMAVISLVGNASVVVMSACGPLKDIILVLLSVVLFQTPISVMQVVGYNVSLLGLCLFREYKNNNSSLLINHFVNSIKVFQFKFVGMWKSTPRSTSAANLSFEVALEVVPTQENEENICPKTDNDIESFKS
jgi:drug/metabolite transporter (DMT)-like permease